MKTKYDIDDCLEKWFEGESTLEEERALKAYFNGDQVAPKHQFALPVFQALEAERNVSVPGPEKRAAMQPLQVRRYWAAAAAVLLLLSGGIWWMNTGTPEPANPVAGKIEVEKPSEPIELQMPPADPVEQPIEKKVNVPPRPKKLAKKKSPRPTQKTNEVDPEAEEAMEDIKLALSLLSSKLNKGKAQARKAIIPLEQIDESLSKVKQKEG